MRVKHIAGLALAGAVVALVACKDQFQTTEPATGSTAKLTTAGGSSTTMDTVQVRIQLDTARVNGVELEIVTPYGQRETVMGNGIAPVAVTTVRPSLVYVLRKADSTTVAFGMVSSSALQSDTLTITPEGTLQTAVLSTPLTLPETFEQLDGMRTSGLSGLDATAAAADMQNDLWSGYLNPESTSSLSPSVISYTEQVTQKLATSPLPPPPQSITDSLVYQYGMPGAVPWVSISPNQGGGGVWISPSIHRDRNEITVYSSSSRPLIIQALGDGPDSVATRISDPYVLPGNLTGSFVARRFGGAPSLPDGPATATIPIRQAAAIKYWGQNSPFRLKVIPGMMVYPVAMSTEDRELAGELSIANLKASASSYFAAVLDPDVAEKTRLEGLACVEDAVEIAARNAGPLKTTLDEISAGHRPTSPAADSAYNTLVANATIDCVSSIMKSVLVDRVQKRTARWFGEKIAKVVGKVVAVLWNVFDNLPILSSGLTGVWTPATGWYGSNWSIAQEWMSSFQFSTVDGAETPSTAATGSTVGVIPTAKLGFDVLPGLPSDLYLFGPTTTGGVTYGVSPQRFISTADGSGTITASWYKSPTGTRQTLEQTVTFCGPSLFRVVPIGYGGTNSNKTTAVVDTLTFRAEVQLSCAGLGSGWVPFNSMILTTNGYSGSPGTMTTTEATSWGGGNTITRAWFTGTGGSAKFLGTFRNANTKQKLGEYPFTQLVGHGRVEVSPDTASITIFAGTTGVASFSTLFRDLNGNIRGDIQTCVMRSGPRPTDCPQGVTVASSGKNIQILGFTPRDILATSETSLLTVNVKNP